MGTQYLGYNATVANFAGGVAGTDAKNLVYRVTFGGAYTAGDKFKFDVVTAAQTFNCGISRVTDAAPTYAITLNDRVHFLYGTGWYFSDNGDSTEFAEQGTGAGYINVANQWQEPENLISLAPYQGRMAVFSNRTTQIWVIDANPNNFSLQQVLSNMGTYCPFGPQSLGDLDVLFPSTTGIRSLRVRDSSLNAFVNDIGSPIDLNMQASISGLTAAQLAATCSIVEPSANRYWHYVNGVIYVLSYFPAAKIMAAWSTYLPTATVAGTTYTFVPSRFVTFNSLVYARVTINSAERLLVFGGTAGTTFDASVATAATSWLDLKTPGTRKQATELDFAITGTWTFKGSMDWKGVTGGGALQTISGAVSAPSFQLGSVAWSDDGFHVKLQAASSGSTAAVLSSMVLHYQNKGEK
jgi:hypothetical protein